jgi:hypothetical protein
VLGLVLTSPWVKRASRGAPVARLLLIAETAMMAQRHLSQLDGTERRRLLALFVRSRGWARPLTAAERLELVYRVARLEPRLMVGTLMARASPVPLPRRLLYGRRGAAARTALSRRT